MNAKNANIKFRSINLSTDDFNLLARLKESPVKTKRAYAVLCDLFLLIDFKEWVTKTRKQLKIPPNGYPSIHPRERALNHNIGNRIWNYLLEKKYFVDRRGQKNKMRDWRMVIKGYLLYGEITENDLSSVKLGVEKDELFDDQLKLILRNDISKEELKSWLDRNWFILKEYRNNLGINGENSRVKLPLDFERDIFIYNKQLEFKPLPQRKYYYNEVADQLKKEFGLTVDSLAVKKAAERFRRKVKILNTSRDK